MLLVLTFLVRAVRSETEVAWWVWVAVAVIAVAINATFIAIVRHLKSNDNV